MQTSTLSPGSTRLATAASMAALPVPEMGRVSSFSVWNRIAQQRLDAVHHRDEGRVEMADDRGHHRLVDAGRHGAGAGPEEEPLGNVEGWLGQVGGGIMVASS
jgi:hypothetical protein